MPHSPVPDARGQMLGVGPVPSGPGAVAGLTSAALTFPAEVHTVSEVGGQESAAPVDASRLLARDYWLILSTPTAGADQAAIDAHVEEHIAWLLALERDDVLFVSGPLLSGPGTGPGSGATAVRAADEDAARRIAADDPFVRAGLRTFEVHRWRLNEGSICVRMSLGTGTYDWR